MISRDPVLLLCLFAPVSTNDMRSGRTVKTSDFRGGYLLVLPPGVEECANNACRLFQSLSLVSGHNRPGHVCLSMVTHSSSLFSYKHNPCPTSSERITNTRCASNVTAERLRCQGSNQPCRSRLSAAEVVGTPTFSISATRRFSQIFWVDNIAMS